MAATKKFDQSGTLMQRTHELLKKDNRSIAIISTDTGITFYWLQRFSNCSMKNPSVNRVQYLYEHLAGKKLNLS